MTSSPPWRLSLGSQGNDEIHDPSWSQIADAFFSLDGQCGHRDWLSLISPQQQSLIICGGNSRRFLVSHLLAASWDADPLPLPTRYLQAVDLDQTGPDLPLCLQPPVSSPAYAVLSWPLLSQIARRFFEDGQLYLRSGLRWEIETTPPPTFLPVPPSSPAVSLHASSPSLLVLGPSSSQSFPSPDWSDLETALFCLDGHSLTHVLLTHPDRGTLAVLGGLQQRYAVFLFPPNQRFPVVSLQVMDPSLAGPEVELCIQTPAQFPSRIAIGQRLAWKILQQFYRTQTIPRDVHWLLEVF
ncbi:hypothetical protein [Thermogemmatispora carboxidivorans]|uniref:hypothetical protein n=1 Tax=Thermogemmatispora carboxidivorans TaxID=1382306 RepID=UPI0006994D1B|nr:hypothetical protein [Thermogemmatispora carboxidivorans]